MLGLASILFAPTRARAASGVESGAPTFIPSPIGPSITTPPFGAVPASVGKVLLAVPLPSLIRPAATLSWSSARESRLIGAAETARNLPNGAEASAGSAGRWFDAAGAPGLGAAPAAAEGAPTPASTSRAAAPIKDDPQAAPNELWVSFGPGVDEARARALLQERGLSVGRIANLGARLSAQGFAKDASAAAESAAAFASAPGTLKLAVHPETRRMIETPRPAPLPAAEISIPEPGPRETESATAILAGSDSPAVEPTPTERVERPADSGPSSPSAGVEVWEPPAGMRAFDIALRFKPGETEQDALDLAAHLGLTVLEWHPSATVGHWLKGAVGALGFAPPTDAAWLAYALLRSPALASIGLNPLTRALFERLRRDTWLPKAANNTSKIAAGGFPDPSEYRLKIVGGAPDWINEYGLGTTSGGETKNEEGPRWIRAWQDANDHGKRGLESSEEWMARKALELAQDPRVLEIQIPAEAFARVPGVLKQPGRGRRLLNERRGRGRYRRPQHGDTRRPNGRMG